MRNISIRKFLKLNGLLFALIMVLGLIGILFNSVDAQSSEPPPRALLIELDRSITLKPDGMSDMFDTTDLFERGLKEAIEGNYDLVVITIDTPGGKSGARYEIVNLIMSAPLPIITFVTPSGARAGSAGTFIAAAGHLFAMTPVSSIGSATSVDKFGMNLVGISDIRAREESTTQLREIAERRGRNASALEETVVNAVSYSASEALELGIADFIVNDVDELLATIDGHTVEIDGSDVPIRSRDAELVTFSWSVAWTIFNIVNFTDGVYILLLIGIIALISGALSGSWTVWQIGVVITIVSFFRLVLIPIIPWDLPVIGMGFLGLASVMYVIAQARREKRPYRTRMKKVLSKIKKQMHRIGLEAVLPITKEYAFDVKIERLMSSFWRIGLALMILSLGTAIAAGVNNSLLSIVTLILVFRIFVVWPIYIAFFPRVIQIVMKRFATLRLLGTKATVTESLESEARSEDR